MLFQNTNPDYKFHLHIHGDVVWGCRVVPQNPNEDTDYYEVQLFIPIPPHFNYSNWVTVISSSNKGYCDKCMESICEKYVGSSQDEN